MKLLNFKKIFFYFFFLIAMEWNNPLWHILYENNKYVFKTFTAMWRSRIPLNSNLLQGGPSHLRRPWFLLLLTSFSTAFRGLVVLYVWNIYLESDEKSFFP